MNKRSWFIKFLETNGKILQISAREISDLKDGELVVESYNKLCRQILQGKSNKNLYAVLWDYSSKEWILDKKTTTLVIESKNNKLVPVQNVNTGKVVDCSIKISKTNGQVQVKVNLQSIAHNMNLGNIEYLVSNDDRLLDIFITKKNDPDYLIASIPIDTASLIKTSVATMQLPDDVLNLIDWDNFSVYTKSVFETYTLEVSNAGFNAQPIIGHLKNIQLADTNSCLDCDINIKTDGSNLVLTSSLNPQQLYYFEGSESFPIIVCDREIDRYITTINIDVNKLCNTERITLRKPILWPTLPLITYKNPNLRINLENN